MLSRLFSTIFMACVLQLVVSAIGQGLKKKRGSSILDLLPEIMDEIFAHLPVVSQACLALSCKRSYQQFECILKAPAFQYPYSDGLDESVDLSPRVQLLVNLESFLFYFRSQRWRYVLWRLCETTSVA